MTGVSVWSGSVWTRALGVHASGFGLARRLNLVKGVDRPRRRVTTGVLPDVSRTDVYPVAEGLYTMATNEVLENVTVHGRVKAAPGAVLRNVRIMGSPPVSSPGINEHLPLLDITSSSITTPSDFLAEDCSLFPRPSYESPQQYAIKGGGGTIRRCELARTVDGAQLYGGSTVIEQCWIGDMSRFSPDPTRADGQATHNDGIQCEGGSWSYTLEGNCFDVWMDDYEVWMAGGGQPSLFGFLLTANTGTPQAVTILNNWFRGGSYPINATTVPSDSLTITGNRIVAGQQVVGGQTYHVIRPTAVADMWTLQNNTNAIVNDFDGWTTDSSTIREKQG